MIGRSGRTAANGAARRVMNRLALLAVVLGMIGVLAGAGGSAAATTVTYGFWNLDGCHYTWAGSVETWRKGECGPSDHVNWGREAASQQLYRWDGQKWQFQGIFNRGTMDTPNGIFIVPFVTAQEEHLFIYEYAEKAWYHIMITKQNVQSVPHGPELETDSGWRFLSDIRNPKLDSMISQWEDVRDDIITF